MEAELKKTVLLVEDDELVRDVMVANLAEEGYAVFSTANAREFMEKLPSVKPDIILLDLMLPDGNGLSLIKGIRECTDVPVIILSGRGELIDKVVGLEMGADDYVAKPVEIEEVTARIRAQLRRYQSMTKAQGGQEHAHEQTKKNSAPRISFGRWILDRPQLQVHDAKGKSARLTVKEFHLLDALAMHPNRVFSREHILDKVRVNDYNVTDRAIDVQIMRIRRKLGDQHGPDEIIRSIRGIGYMFVAETEIV